MRGWLKSTFGPDALPQLDIEIQEKDAEILTSRLGVLRNKRHCIYCYGEGTGSTVHTKIEIVPHRERYAPLYANRTENAVEESNGCSLLE